MQKLAYTPEPSEPRMLSTVDAARRLGITSGTLHRYIKRGDLVAYRYGYKTWRVCESEIQRFLDSLNSDQVDE